LEVQNARKYGKRIDDCHTSSVLGFVISAVVSAVLPASMSGSGNGLAVLFNLVSILVG
jgi:hypothetical protein